MKKLIFLLMIVTGLFYQTQAQDVESASADTAWKISGVNSLLFNQSSFSNWAAGGQGAVALNALFDYNFNYSKARWNWDNKLKAGYGVSNIEDRGWRKSEDILSINSLLGYKINKYWQYSFFLDFLSQFAKGYRYPNEGPRTYISNILAPAYLQFGPGISYRRSENLYFNLSPVASKLIIVTDDELSAQGLYGVDPGKKTEYQLGANFSAYYKVGLVKNVTMENKLQLFSNYLDKPQNVDVDYQLNLNMKINDYLSTYFGLQMIYDDDVLLPLINDQGQEYLGKRLQLKQLFGAGFTYRFGPQANKLGK